MVKTCYDEFYNYLYMPAIIFIWVSTVDYFEVTDDVIIFSTQYIYHLNRQKLKSCYKFYAKLYNGVILRALYQEIGIVTLTACPDQEDEYL